MSRTFELLKEKAALVIVDLQNDFVRQGAPMQVESALSTVPANQRLIAYARQTGMPVIFTKFLSGKSPVLLWNWSPEIQADSCCRRGFQRYYPDIDRMEQCADIIDELKPLSDEDYIVEKYNYSAFRGTNLKDILHSEGVDTVIVTGTVTQICVEDTVHDGFAEGFKVVVASDCVSTWDLLQQKASIENFANKYGMVLTSEEIIQSFR